MHRGNSQNNLERHESSRRGGSAVTTRRRAAGVVVRRATAKDLPAIVGLRMALLREEARNPLFADPHPDATRRAARLTRTELAARDQVLLMAIRDHDIVGMLRCRAVRRTPLVADSRQAVVTTVYVVPSQRRSGVLRALLGAADRWCRRHRLSGMRLQCSLTNDVGRRAWESLGFEPAEVVYHRSFPTA
jgi:GNAT superfamily N-acetyltransferase